VEVAGEGGGKRDSVVGETTEQSQEVICYQSFIFLALKSKAKKPPRWEEEISTSWTVFESKAGPSLRSG
jgi:hypothetical protein